MKKETKVIIVLLAVLIVAVVAGIVIITTVFPSDRAGPLTVGTSSSGSSSPDGPLPATPKAADENGNEEEQTTGDGQIAIPGYTVLSLKAGKLNQTVSFSNPERNNCFFQLSLSLPDGTLLWRSELIAPGEKITELSLTQTLEKGSIKDASLHYSCFSLDEDMKPLNGADIKLTLKVS